MKIKVNKQAIEMLFFKTTVLFKINVETVFWHFCLVIVLL